MEIKEIQVGFTYTKNLGNYESLKVDGGAVITVRPGEDPEELYSNAYETVRNQIKKGLDVAKGGF